MPYYSSAQVIRSLFIGVVCCILVVHNHLGIRAHQIERQERVWGEIAQLYTSGWVKREEKNYRASEKIFRQVVRKLEQYRSRYIKDQNSLSFLRATRLLGNSSELGMMDKEALVFYSAALLIDPPANSVREQSEIHLIKQEIKERLPAVTKRISPKSPSKDYPRINIKGGSKGGERDLPKREMIFQP